MPEAYMRLVVDAGTDKKAHRVITKLLDHVSAETVSIEPYHKGGFDVGMKVSVDGADWPTQVVSLIDSAQSFGLAWTVTGYIREEVSMTSSSLKVPGLTFVSLSFRKL